MRHLTLPIGHAGAILDVSIGLSGPHLKARRTAGLDPIPPTDALLLVDTGASSTHISTSIIRGLQLQPTGSGKFHSASTKGVPVETDVFDISLFLARAGTRDCYRIDVLPVLSSSFDNQPFDGVLGRDVLRRVKMAWDGPAGNLVLSYQ